jgi:hypothetical protein
MQNFITFTWQWYKLVYKKNAGKRMVNFYLFALMCIFPVPHDGSSLYRFDCCLVFLICTLNPADQFFMKKPKTQKAIEGLTGTILIGFGIKLALEKAR